MGDDELKVIAAELVTQVRKSVTIDWTLRESARAKIRVMVKRILNQHGYPPDLAEAAVKTVLQQAELLCADWVMDLSPHHAEAEGGRCSGSSAISTASTTGISRNRGKFYNRTLHRSASG